MVKDIYNAVQKYSTRIDKIRRDLNINPKNKELFIEWLGIKELELKRRKGADEVAKIRYYKTLNKYSFLLKGTDRLFNHKYLKDITQADIEKLFFDLEEGRIKLAKATRKDYYNKIFKSDFFKFIGKQEFAKNVIKLESSDDEEVKFFEKADLDLMTKFSSSERNKLFLYFLFDTGMRIGEVLNLKFKDIELRHNPETKRDYYMVHVDKDITKSKSDRHIPLMMNETNELMRVYLKFTQNEDFLFGFGYTNARMLISRVKSKAKIKTKPEGKEISIHDFRKSSATYYLAKGYSIDFVKARLGHKPSSNVIDRYVNYLGLNDGKSVTMSQSMEYNDLQNNYKEALERIKVLDANQKGMHEEMKNQIEAWKKNIKKELLEEAIITVKREITQK